ncbi:sugar ABC transporter permease [Clostridium perfringens]|uniref:Putative maltose/maltodextrin ABC transporter, permease protein n=1 Tax=Clostridium perfringens (strain SM101 / Type A) TaxID=289380 RepID=Q0SQK6_CLOPS|nr:ABC transporter permease subunit [Clostridium perfringens]ABG87652.1 putative maltose/maltodextrin ABC transporter, permease protein [Clostridium perfringens SM101]MBP2862227.1 ABC transporter permease subunit [Clostridium perfringens]MDH5060355.1 Maltose transport system permease protein MalG [Clostridium perfringens NCTC 8239]CAG9352404.1 maltose ABC transporter [Clostridium perfringens NCTC 8239]SQB58923.1 maltose ABC transporter [Clostridium perfringens]
MQSKVQKKSGIVTTSELKYERKLRPAERRMAWISRIFIWFMLLVVLFPVFEVVSASMAKGEVFTQTTLIPSAFTLENYSKVLTETNFLIWVKNSLIICVVVSVIQLLLTVPMAFAFSRLKFWGRKNGLMMLLLLQMFPAAMSLPAILALAYRLDGMDHIITLIIVQAGAGAFNIWLLKGAIDGIPKELTEAAYVDGASTFQTFTMIILPLLRNMLLVIFLFTFIGAYSEFVFASALLKSPESLTLAVGMQQFITNNFSANWTQYSAAAIMASIPIVAFATIAQKYMAKGLTAGSVKG